VGGHGIGRGVAPRRSVFIPPGTRTIDAGSDERPVHLAKPRIHALIAAAKRELPRKQFVTIFLSFGVLG
jgi:hypothetical protein